MLIAVQQLVHIGLRGKLLREGVFQLPMHHYS